MKKIIFAIIACTFVACPAFANEFNVEQTMILNEIEGKMAISKGDEAKLAQLIKQKGCVEKATDLDGLQGCLSKFQTDQLQGAVKTTKN